jgi:hypothetical protein
MNNKKNVKSPEKQKERFLSFVFQKQQRLDWIIIAVICLIGYIVVKYFYPYPATMSDSGLYVVSAMKNRFSFYRPFGYSYFLQITHSLSSNIHTVFIFQMLLYFISTAVFAFTIKYFFFPKKKNIWYSLLVFLSFSPLAFFLSNSVMSDMIFSVAIYFMLSGFIFIIMKQNWGGAVLYLAALFCTLFIRYSAAIFPFLFIPFFLLSKKYVRWIAIVCSILIFVVFYTKTEKSMKETTGFKQFSTGFDGWQLANNALHIFPYIDLKPESIKDKKLREFHKFILPYKDSIAKTIDNVGHGGITADILWAQEMPLKQYLFKSIQEQKCPYPKVWITLGSGLYSDYGRYLILHYPFKFMRYYYLPNAVSMFYPVHTGLLRQYKGVDFEKDIIDWYNIPENKDLSCKKDIYASFLTKCILISYIFIWIGIAVIAAIGIIYRKKIKFNKQEKLGFWGLFTFGTIYYASTIFMSPIELRYWLPMACFQFAFCYVLLNKVSEYKIFHKQKQEDK